MNDPQRFLDALDLPDQLRKDLTVARQQERYETTWGFVQFLSLSAAIDLPSHGALQSIPGSPASGAATSPPTGMIPDLTAPQSLAAPQSLTAPQSLSVPTAVLPPPAAAASTSGVASSTAAMSTSTAAASTVSSAWSLKALAMVAGHGTYWGVASGVGVAATLLTATALLTSPAPSISTAPSISAVSSFSTARSLSNESTRSLMDAEALPSTTTILDLDAISPQPASATATVFGLDDLPPALSDETPSHKSSRPQTSAKQDHHVESTPPPGSLSDEVHELKGLRQLLDRSPDQVLARLQQSRFNERGALEPERRALAIAALLRLGRADEAHQRAVALIARYPSSPAGRRWRCELDPSDEGCSQP